MRISNLSFYARGIALLLLTAIQLPAFALSEHDYARLCDQAYLIGNSGYKPPSGFSVLATKIDKASGFQGAAYTNGSAVVIAFAGTQLKDPKDVLADLGIGVGDIDKVGRSLLEQVASKIHLISHDSLDKAHNVMIRGTANTQAQIRAAEAFYQEVKGKLGTAKPQIFISGHSLGGFLAQVVVVRTNTPAVTFNAPGAGSFGSNSGSSITNHVRQHDLVGSYGKHIGKVVTYNDVKFQLTNYKERYLMRNHGIAEFIDDLKQGLKAVR